MGVRTDGREEMTATFIPDCAVLADLSVGGRGHIPGRLQGLSGDVSAATSPPLRLVHNGSQATCDTRPPMNAAQYGTTVSALPGNIIVKPVFQLSTTRPTDELA